MPYDIVEELEEINDDFTGTNVTLVIGAVSSVLNSRFGLLPCVAMVARIPAIAISISRDDNFCM